MMMQRAHTHKKRKDEQIQRRSRTQVKKNKGKIESIAMGYEIQLIVWSVFYVELRRAHKTYAHVAHTHTDIRNTQKNGERAKRHANRMP